MPHFLHIFQISRHNCTLQPKLAYEGETMNRFLCVLSAVIMTFALTACGQQTSQQAAAPTADPAKAASPEAAAPSAAPNVAEAPKGAAAAKPADVQPKPVTLEVPQ